MKKKPQTITEKFTVDPYQGMAAFAAAISKPGYHVSKMVRKGTKATITYEKDDEPIKDEK